MLLLGSRPLATQGLTDEDLQALPASVQKAFARDTLSTGPPCALPKPKSAAPPSTITGALEEAGSACTTSSIVESPLYVGLGVDMGLLDVVDGSASARRNGRAKVDQGRMLLRDSWNADLYGELQRVWTDAQAEEGKEGQRKDKIKTFWCHKVRAELEAENEMGKRNLTMTTVVGYLFSFDFCLWFFPSSSTLRTGSRASGALTKRVRPSCVISRSANRVQRRYCSPGCKSVSAFWRTLVTDHPFP